MSDKVNLLNKENLSKIVELNRQAEVPLNTGLDVNINDPIEFRNQTGQSLNTVLSGNSEVFDANNSTRTPLQFIGDSANIAGKTVSTGLLDTLSFGTKFLLDKNSPSNLNYFDPNQEIPTAISNFSSDVGTFFDKYVSEPTTQRRKVTEEILNQRKIDNENKYNESINKGDNPLYSSLVKGGRDALSGFLSATENPSNFVDSAIGGASSIATGNLLAKGAMKIANKTLQTTASKIASTTVTSAIMEASSTGQEIQQEILNTTDFSNSDRYKSLIESGKGPDEAKQILASEVSILASLANLPVSLVLQKFSTNIDAFLPKKYFADMAKEGIEEAVQNAVNEFTKNASIQKSVDPNISLFDNLAVSAGQGAGAGVATASVFGLPSATGRVLGSAVTAQKNRSDVRDPNGEKATNTAINKLNEITLPKGKENNLEISIDGTNITGSVEPNKQTQGIVPVDSLTKAEPVINAFKSGNPNNLLNTNINLFNTTTNDTTSLTDTNIFNDPSVMGQTLSSRNTVPEKPNTQVNQNFKELKDKPINLFNTLTKEDETKDKKFFNTENGLNYTPIGLFKEITPDPKEDGNKEVKTYTGSEFSKSLYGTEGGEYTSDNKLDGYSRGIGSIQFIANRLQALKPKLNGLVTDEDFIKVKEENGKDGYRYTDQFIKRFKDNENGIQDLANEVQYKTLDEETKPYEKYIGQTIQGVEVTKSGLMASAHLGGVGGLKNFLTGKSNAKDANNTSIAEYMQKHGNKDIYNGSSLQTVVDPQTNEVSGDINTFNEPITQSIEQTEEIVLTPQEKQQDVLQVTSKEDKDDQFVANLPEKVKTTVNSSQSKPEVVKQLVTDIKANVYTDVKESNSAKLLAVSEYDKLVQYIAEAEESDVTNQLKTVVANTSKDIEAIRESIQFPDDFSLNHTDFDTTFKFAKVSPSKVSINYLNKLFDGSNESNEFLGTMKPNKVETLRNLHEQNTIINDNLLIPSKDGNPKNTAKVSQEIRDIGFNGDEKVKKGLNKHLDDFNIINSGGIVLNKENQPVTLDETVQGIQNFAQHMKGKAEAITESANTKGNPKVKYPVWTGKEWYSAEETKNEGVYHNPNSVESTVNNAMIFSDAYRTIRTYNSIAKKYNKTNKENQLKYIALPDAPKDIKNYSNKLNKSFSEQQKDEVNYYSGSDSNIRKSQKFIDPTLKKESGEKDTKKETKPVKVKKTSVKKDSKPKDTEPTKQEKNTVNNAKKQAPFWKVIQVNPDSNLGKELIKQDITPKNSIGLFSKEGIKNADQIIVSEYPDYDIKDDGAGYADHDSLVELIIDSRNSSDKPKKSTPTKMNNDLFSNKNNTTEQEEVVEDVIDEINPPPITKEDLIDSADREEEINVLDVVDPSVDDVNQETNTVKKNNTLNIWFGSQENVWLSNLAKRKFTYQNKEYLSVEHAYQTLKSGNFSEKTYNNPGWVNGGKHGANNTKANTNINPSTGVSYNLELMKNLIKESFIQNPELKEKLINLGDVQFTHTQDTGIWQTKFPELLTEVKNELTDTTKSENITTKNIDENLNENNELGSSSNSLSNKLDENTNLNIQNNEFTSEKDKQNYINEKITKDLVGKDIFENYITFNENVNSLEAILTQLKDNGLAFFDLFGSVRKGIIDKLNEAVNTYSKYITSKEETDLIKRRSPEFHVLNFTKLYEKKEEYYKDKFAKIQMYGYNNEIISKALLAFSLWFSDLNPEDPRFYNNMISDKNSENEVVFINDTKDESLGDTKTYYSKENIAKDLSKYIKAVLGINFKGETPLVISGIIESLAKEILTVISQEADPLIKFMDKKGELISDPKKKPTLIKIDKEVLNQIKENIKEFNKNNKKSGINVLKEILNASEFISYSVGLPIENKSTTIKNSKNLISEPQKQKLNKLNSVPNYLNKELFNVFKEIASNQKLFNKFKTLFVRIPKNMNVNTRKTIEGKQQTLLDNMFNMFSIATEIAGLEEDAPVYIKHEINTTGRADAGIFSGQSNKMIREILNPNKSTFDLDDEEKTDFYLMSIAQALGAKTEYKKAEDSKQYVRDFYNNNRELIEASKNKNYKEVVNLLLNQDEITEVYFHAVIDLGRYINAINSKDIEFTTSIYLESDGKTDGPGNLLVNFDPFPITIDSIKRLAKVGYLIGSKNKTLADYYQEDNIDLYQESVNKLQEINTPKVRLALEMFATLGLDVTLNADDTITIDRGFGKSPVTVVGYGSEVNGLSRKLVNTVVDEIYSLMTEYLNTRKAETKEKINSVTQKINKIIENYNNSGINDKEKVSFLPNINTSNYEKFKFTPLHIQSMIKALKSFSQTFMDVIKGDKGVLGNTTPVMNLVKDITQLQSIFAQEVFKQRINEYVDTKKIYGIEKKYPKETLTLKVLDDIFKELQTDGILPEYKTDLINLYIGYTERTEFDVESSDALPRSDKKVGSGLLLGSYSTKTQVNGPEDAGVSGIPIINIGTGDALMMLNAFVNDLVTNALNVYDGLNSGINDVKSNSLGINQAVYMGYQTDHLKPLISSTNTFIKALNSDKYKDTEIIYNNKNDNVPITAKILTDFREGNYNFTDIIKNITPKDLKSLIDFNKQILAKKKVLNRIVSSIDHMASANVPFITEPQNPIDVSNLDQQQLVDKINEEINKELGIEPIKEDKPLVIKTLEDLNDLIPVKDVTNELKDAYKILKDNINIVSETNLEINRNVENSDPNQQGRYDFENNVINIFKNAKNKVETLIHELLHGVTGKKVWLYYNDKKTLSQKDIQAIEAIEAQMNKFMKENPNNNFTTKYKAQNSVTQVSEFITYVLTNKRTQETAKNTLVERIIGKVNIILEKIFGLTSKDPSVYDVVLLSTQELSSSVTPTVKVSNISLNHITDENIDMSVKSLNLPDAIAKTQKRTEISESFDIQETFNELTNVGFKFTEEQSIRFTDYLTVFNKAVLNNNNIINSMNKIFSKIVENLTVEDFLNTSKNMNQAKEQYDLITNITDINSFGSILGLYQLDENFANAIKDISLKKKLNKDQNIDRLFEDLASTGIDLLNGINRQPTVGKSLDMINQIVKTTKPRRELYNIPNNYLSQANKKTYDAIDNALKLLGTKANVFKVVRSVYNKEMSKELAEFVINSLNKASVIPLGLRELAKEFIGKIPLTSDIENMLKLVKSQVQAVRQAILVELPKILANNFKTKMKLSNWSTLYNTIGISDILSINDNVFDTIEMIKNNNVIEQIRLIEKKLDPRYIEKSKQLANFIINKEEGNNLLRNSYAIGRLLNETDSLNADPSEDIIKLIDDLVSLYAYELLSDEVKKDFNDLITNDREAVEYLANTVKEIQKTEKEKALTGYAKYTHLKGYLPENIKDGKRIIIAEDTDYKDLVRNGYTRIGDYSNTSEKSIVKKGYYYSDVIGSGYVSGVLQTIHQSASGVDPVTGKMLSHRTVNKLITGTYVSVLNKRLVQHKGKNSGFIPVFDANGKLYAYERVIDKEILNKLNPDEELHKVIAVLKGRQEEEKLAEEFNKILIDRAFELKEKDYENNKDSYINLSTSDDPIHQDIWNVIPKTTKQYINKVFGKNQFYIRKELLNNMVGYRVPSVQDLFTGKSRFDKKTQETFQKLVMTVFGDKAFKYLSVTEKGIQSVVGFTKESIVVKSIAVPVMNFLANIVELSSFGVSIPDIARYMLEGFTDLNTHIKNNKRKLKIQSDLLATNDPVKKDKLNKELQSINVIEDNLKIKPLLDAGEFNTIVEEADIGIDDALKNNNISDWIENQIDKLPGGVKTLARYAVISKNTALYKGLSRSIQYGDFLSKYALYQYTKKDEQIKNPLLTKNEIEKLALEQISEAFVDYNFNSGRIGTGLDLYGLTWFKTYRIRITKIALRLMRDKPVTTLLSTLLGNTLMPVGTGSLIEDNIFGGINTNGWNNIIEELSQPNMLKLF